MIFPKVEILSLIIVFAKWFSDVDAMPQPFEEDNAILEETKSHSLRYVGDKIRHGRDDEPGLGVKRNLSSNKKSKKFKVKKDNKVTKKESKDNKGSRGIDTRINTEAVRLVLARFVDSLDADPHRERGYHLNAGKQMIDYNTCTVVQQCLDPPFILSLGLMSVKSRSLVYKTLSAAMSQESFNMLQLQQHSNMLLGEMQDWATTCHGECRELKDPNGLLHPIVGGNLKESSDLVENTDYEQCGDLRNKNKRGEERFTLWYCEDEPRMVHQADIDVTTGKYKLGNIWNEPHVHGRNSQYDYFSVYGDMVESGGAFGFRFSGHHMDLNYMWNEDGILVQDFPVFLGHNPLIVPETTPPMERDHDERAHPDQFYDPLMWNNMAGVAQFAEGVQLVLDCASELLLYAPTSYVPLTNWVSKGYIGALQFAGGKAITDFDFVDLSHVSDETFSKYWSMIEYTLKFARGDGSTDADERIFRSEGKAVWTTSTPPEEGLPLTEDDLRSNLNFLNLRIETDELLFFVMVNQLYTVISENEPTNHLHSILIQKNLINPDHACIGKIENNYTDPLCVAPKRQIPEPVRVQTMSAVFKYETSLWEERSLKGKSILDIDTFEKGLLQLSKDGNNMGITGTLFNEKAEKVFQKTVGSEYSPMSNTPGFTNSERYDPLQSGWTGDTQFAIFSNTKGFVAATYLSSVVDTGLGALDEPIHEILSELSIHDAYANITARMILSHSSGGGRFDRFSRNDPHYNCKYDPTTTMEECVVKYLQLGLESEPGTFALYNNDPFDIISLLILRKTGKKYTDVVAEYMTTPLGMTETSYDCPAAKSTSDKPQVAFGMCSTGHDYPKFPQMLANKGLSHDGKRVLSLYSVQQMFSRGTGTALNGSERLLPGLNLILSSCVARNTGIHGIMGYGLGTMFIPGRKGEVFAHAGSNGGFWAVAPGRYSVYIASSTIPQPDYSKIALMMDMFERKSTFMVSNNIDGVAEVWEELTTCGDGMYTELSSAEINNVLEGP